ncbi:TIGR01212 family radical SAM protein [Candidatus Entotheonella palauensis]|uniref:TIGR01212 family radical SAM protein n=1 Tax=Candidatus Entotheonella palauensis TaxID=93172 RepID=UPI000B7E91F1|nr:TIGR01212 family radical SAM protein [Candidatus Entotheonella palauensis]
MSSTSAPIKPRYVSYATHLRQTFGCRVHKVSIDAGFTCPNRDGSVTTGGCIYCNNTSFSPGNRRLSITEQIETGKAFLQRRYGAKKFIAYFQAYTNTYADIAHLQDLYDEALACDDIVGLSVGTRPDCVPDAVLDLLASYASHTYLWLELGLESGHDQTLALINRGHNVAAFDDAVSRARLRNLNLCTHVILGLPGETPDDMRATIRHIANLCLDAIKLHHLHIVRQTVLEKMYRKGSVSLLSLDAYAALVADCLELLPPDTIIMRLMGDAPRDMLVAPMWSQDKRAALNRIEQELERRDIHQGSAYTGTLRPNQIP